MMLCTVVPAMALGALVPASAPAESDVFLQAEGLLGESQVRNYEDAIEVRSFSWGVSNQASAGSIAAKPSFSDISVTKFVDRSSPTLVANLTTGKVIPRAKVTFVKPGLEARPFLRFCFTGLRVSSVQVSGSDGGGVPMESVSFSYATVVEAYQQQLPNGNLADPVFGGWDLINKLQFGNASCSSPF